MGNKSWQQLAAKARKIARRIINGDEEDYKGERLAYIVDRLDVFATDALNKKYANNGSVGSIHTYAGGTQVISTRHTDGSEGSFNTDGECRPTDNPMDIEVDTYINGGNGGGSGQSSPAATTILPESKTNKNMKKNVVKLNENTLRQIVAESVKKVLNEMENEGLGDRFRGAVQGFQQGKNQMQQTSNAAFVGGVANNYLQSIKQAIQYLHQGNSNDALETLKMVYNNIGSASNKAGMQQQWGHQYSEMPYSD